MTRLERILEHARLPGEGIEECVERVLRERNEWADRLAERNAEIGRMRENSDATVRTGR